nr:unnamed protein product [Digitaria exilis]
MSVQYLYWVLATFHEAHASPPPPATEAPRPSSPSQLGTRTAAVPATALVRPPTRTSARGPRDFSGSPPCRLIIEAKCLPNMDLMTERMRKCFTGYGACSTDCGKSDPHPDMRKIITSDPYVSVCLSGATVAQTRVIANSENPKWDEHFYVQVAHSVSRVEFHVKDNDVFGAELIGVASIPVEHITPGDAISGWFPISGQYSNPMKASPELHLSIQYKQIDMNPLYKDGVGADGSQSVGVPNAYFPLRKGDLCDGRYDTPEHRLFKDLDTVFKDDFHNPTFPVNKLGPRQPWHDLHCKIEGPAAYDILTNFEQRWRKSAKWKVSVRRAVFRSIDSGSVKGFPKLVQEAESQIDKSIHNAYVKAIRSAQHFVYIENQYFIGSSYYWSAHRSAGAENLIPIELAIKIARKIKAKERFAAYIVIPMWPEGNPTTAAMQEILYWQGHTMSMMYKIVADALRKEGLHERHPQEYLNFYCLGKREVLSDVSTMNNSNDNSTLVYGYRMSLWAEHLGTVEECFRRPESEECVQWVNQVADDNWASYVSPQMVDMRGHLLRYPVRVEQDGRVGPLPGQEIFPDVGGKVMGTHSSLPNALTT